jgi:hypothetical protein
VPSLYASQAIAGALGVLGFFIFPYSDSRTAPSLTWSASLAEISFYNI